MHIFLELNENLLKLSVKTMIAAALISATPFMEVSMSNVFLYSLLLRMMSSIIFSIFLISALMKSRTRFNSFSFLHSKAASCYLGEFSFIW